MTSMHRFKSRPTGRTNPAKLRVFLCLAAGLLAAAVAAPARAQLNVDIEEGFVEPLPIAITDLFGEVGEEAKLGADIASVVAADLERSGLFRPVEKGAFIQDSSSLRYGPRFGDWRLINAQALVSGVVQLQADGRMVVQFRLWDTFSEVQMRGTQYTTPPANWRGIAHRIADEIYQRLTGERGYFNTQIVYIAEQGPQNRRIKRLAIMDQDGANHRFLTSGNELVLTPRFSPSSREITYMAYQSNGRAEVPRVYLFNLNTGQQEVLGDFPGMTFAPRFSSEGNAVILSMAKDGNSEIYTVDLRTRRQTRLTNHPAIDTSPSFSPDSREIVFNSDRGGRPQIYVMNSDGSNVRRISRGQGYYYTPVWSPRGDLIAFTRQHAGEFYIGVMRPDGTGERMLVRDYNVEAPTWAPNGRVLSYFRSSRADSRGQISSKIFTIDLTGFNERELVTPLDASDPAWSPLIQ
ncbi:Tol-Pal system beta propeller repeat protein TolB [Pelagibius sp. CAU 1746]|uniref:Tol-Pal system beta propeller repeat protein TolB n=1 Tax=Pelagibius sp. CAU 1746 TaxID=3140370 RepID=UPI00325AD3C0